MQGKRIHQNDEGHLAFSEPGQYGQDKSGVWYASIPREKLRGESLLVGNLGAHDVIEHEDGTITVLPSILVEDWRGEKWHGYLERGIWREV